MARSGGGLWAWLGVVGALLAAAPAAALETPGTARFEGVSLGMDAAALQHELVSRGFVAQDEDRHGYVNDTTPVFRILSFVDAPGLTGRVVSEIDYSVRYPLDGFDPERVEREVRERFGEPEVLNRSHGRVAMLYREAADAPSVGDVMDACRAEIERAEPGTSQGIARYRAEVASEYRPHNRSIEAICPGALDLYRRFAASVEAPRMSLVISPQIGTIDFSLRWALLATPIEPEGPADPARDACRVPR